MNAPDYSSTLALFLLSTAPQTITHVHIALTCNNPKEVKWTEWDQVLGRLAHLKCVEFGAGKRTNSALEYKILRLTAPPEKWALGEVLKKCLPKARSRGVVRVYSEIR